MLLRKRFCAHMTDATTPADDDLVAMYLTDKKNGILHNKDDHEELEVLLESFSKQVEEIVNEAETIQVRKIPRARSMWCRALNSPCASQTYNLRRKSWS